MKYKPIPKGADVNEEILRLWGFKNPRKAYWDGQRRLKKLGVLYYKRETPFKEGDLKLP